MWQVLVVDDDPGVRAAACRVVELSRAAATAADGPREALEQLRSQRFDAMLTDYSMPGMNGIDLARQALQLHPGLSVVVMSGNPVAQQAERSGFAFIAKPFSASALQAAVEQALSPRASGRFRRSDVTRKVPMRTTGSGT